MAYSTPILCALLSCSCFLLGALYQQDVSYRNLKKVMRFDPYAYCSRRKIFDSLGWWVDEKQENEQQYNEDQSDSSRLFCLHWIREKVQKLCLIFSFGIDRHHQQRMEDAMPAHIADIMKYGFPGLEDIRVYKNFVLSYDRRNRIARWVCEHLSADSLMNSTPVNRSEEPEFHQDQNISVLFQTTIFDYNSKEWLPTQMASPLNHKYNAIFYEDTFKLTNVAPQTAGLRNLIWRRLEKYVRDLALKSGSVYVYTGPLFMPRKIKFGSWIMQNAVIGPNTVAVPNYFFKVIISEHKNAGSVPFMEGYVVPNALITKEESLLSYLSDIDDIEHFAGLKFYEGMRRDAFFNEIP